MARQHQHIRQPLRALVRERVVQALEVVGLEGARIGFEAREPDDAGASVFCRRGAQQGHEIVHEHVVPEDVGAEDFAERRFVGAPFVLCLLLIWGCGAVGGVNVGRHALG